VATQTAEQKAAVEVLMMKSRILWEAIVKASPPDVTARAIRSKLGFEALDDESIGTVAEVVVDYEKGLSAAISALEKVQPDAAQNGVAVAEKPIDVVPPGEVEVLPADTKKPSRTSQK